MYALVMWRTTGRHEAAEVTRRHVEFITDQILRNKILLGGALEAEARPHNAAYLLWVETIEEGRTICGEDPLIREGFYDAVVAQWHLVGINPDAIENHSSSMLSGHDSNARQRSYKLFLLQSCRSRRVAAGAKNAPATLEISKPRTSRRLQSFQYVRD